MTFSEKARQVHGDKYDYTNTVYISSRKPITYLCPLHGEVTQLAKSHLAGKGCRQCGYITRSKKQTSTTEAFIEKARQVHGDRYDYSLTKYTKAKEHVEIACRTCGHCFRQTPDDHLRGKGCAKCAGNHKRTQEDFVEDSRKIHGERYEYGRYTGRDNYLEILCRNCGQTFEITANNHLNGYGCKVCYPGFVDPCRMSEEERGAKLGEFISEVSELYQGKYDYSEFDYITSRTPSTIICPEHGRFLKTPYLHRKGYGCPVCASSISKGQKYWVEFFRQYGEVLVDTYPFGEKKQIDIYLPELRLAVEYNGIPGHHSSTTGIEFFDRGTKHAEYHKEKYELCKKHGITLIHIFEFENTKKWERRLREYLRDPQRFQIGYSNEKRTILRSKIKLTYYGKTIMKKMFNEEADYNDSSLLFGKDVGLFDTVNRHHPRLWDLYKEAVSFNWSETEFTFNECLKEFARKDDVAEIMINTLAYQWEADSVVAHTLLPLLAPFITNTELNAVLAFNTYMECLTPDHKVLVKDKGWVWIKDVVIGDTVVQYDPNNNTLNYAPVQGVVAKPYNDNIITFKNKLEHFTQKVTKGHRMPVKWLYQFSDRGVQFSEAKDVRYHGHNALPVAARKVGGLVELSPLDKLRIAFQADGSYVSDKFTGKRTGCIPVRFSFKKVRKINEFESLLAELGYDWSEIKNSNEAKKDYKSFYVKVPLQDFDKNWKTFDWVNLESVSYEWCREFVEYSKHWDGCDRRRSKNSTCLVTYTAKSRVCAEQYQTIACFAGYRAKMYNTTDDCLQVTVTASEHILGNTILTEEVPYNGMVYCITVPSGAFLVKHEDKISITGNCVHAATYSEIVRNSFKDPTKVIEDIVARKEAVERLEPCGKVLQELHDMGHRYALGQATLEEAFPVVYRGLVALYCLERIGFIASFAITFAIGEAGLYLPISQAVRKICADEIQIHAEVDLYVLRELKKDSKFTQFFTPELEKDVEAIVDEVARAEAEWTDYLFDGKSLVGVNANLIKDWVTFNVQIVKHELRLPYEKKIKQNPLPWITQWMSQNNLQASPMEQDIGQYKIGGISDDIGDMEIDMDF